IKRLIGLPGDRVQMVDSVLHINGQPVGLTPTEPFVQPYTSNDARECTNHPVGLGGPCETPRLIETLPNGVSHDVLDAGRTPADDTDEYLVPAGHYFFMGDNRDNSSDSRVANRLGGVGYVPFENLIGRADRIIFSSAGTSLLAFWTWRADRFFRAVY
ncbi:MAG TPA: signal peptidase I, partial [Paracoccaceae bacterium]|nr:signal peptidase I [Paracoccaceae bacterium]